MSNPTHDAIVHQQFSPQAQAYLHSVVHAQGGDLDDMVQWVGSEAPAAVLDVGCGGGHVAFRLAPLAQQVLAYDPSQAMLDVVAAEAQRRGLGNVRTQQGAAESLPFAAGSFDLVASRYSAHHWGDVPAGLAQMRRVLKTNGRALLMDVVSPGVPLLDTWLQTLELLRDPSHVRNACVADWCAMLAVAGLRVDAVKTYRLRLDFATWIARMKTPTEHVAAIRSLQSRAGAEVVRHFEIEGDGSFTVDTVLIAARAV